MESFKPGNSKSPFRLDGETALITGGGSGLGRAIAQSFIQSGAQVILTGRTESSLQVAVRLLGAAATYRVHDIANPNGTDALLEELGSCTPTILVNNAGLHLKKSATETTEQEFLEIQNVHVKGAFALTRRLIPGMLKEKHGNILFIASMASLMGLPQTIDTARR